MPGVRDEGQYWPDGRGNTVVPSFNYANDQAGAHRLHVQAIAFQLFGETVAELVSLTASTQNPTLTARTKQIQICAFCHFNPGQGVNFDHSVDFSDPPSGAQRVEVLQGGSAGNYFQKFTTGVRTTSAGRTSPTTRPAARTRTPTRRAETSSATTRAPRPARADRLECPARLGGRDQHQVLQHHLPRPGDVHNAHDKHSGAANKNYECRECHVDNGVNLQHGNGKVEMQAGTAPWLWNNPLTVEGSFGAIGGADGFYDRDRSGAATAGDTGFAYKNSDIPVIYTDFNASCNFIYCHGDDNGPAQLPAADRGTDVTPQWGLPATAACGTCHGASTASPVGSLSHPKHAGSAAGQYAIRCQACHYGTTTDGTTIASQTLHVNASAEVSFNTLGDSRVHVNSSYGGNTVMGSGYGACAATYCHSRGNDTAAPYNDVPLSVPLAALPAWGDPGPLACSSCHGNPTAALTVDESMPDYAEGAPKANKHDIHSTTNQFACQVCHYPTTQATDTIASTALHVNASYDAGPNAAGAALYQFSWTSPNCNAVVCHGGYGAITWATAGPYACSVCHGSVGGAVTNADVDDFAWAGATPTMSKIGNADYVADGGGHGDNSGANRPNQLCSGCHASGTTAAHDTTAGLTGPNPFRLVDQNGGALGVQYSCSAATGATACHTGGAAINGPQTGVDIRAITTHTSAAMALAGYTTKRTWPAWTVQGPGTGLECANCHDPHGDGNLSMVNRWVYDKGPFLLPATAPAADRADSPLVHRRRDGRRVGLVRLGHRHAELQRHLPGVPRGTRASSPSRTAAPRSPGRTTRTRMRTPGTAPTATGTTGPSAPPSAWDCHNGSVPWPRTCHSTTSTDTARRPSTPTAPEPRGRGQWPARTATNSPTRTRAPT